MTDPNQQKTPASIKPSQDTTSLPSSIAQQPDGEIGGTKGQEPTIFGDWQHAGRCSDF